MALEIESSSSALGSLTAEGMASSSSSPEVVEAPAHCKKIPSEYILRKYLLMLATLVATVTYGAGFSPPGGVWQASTDGHLAGDPIVLTTNNLRYLVFFYCNAFALASSVLVIILFLLLSIDLIEKKEVVWIRIKPLRVLMVLDLLSFMGAYAAGSCRDMLSTVYTSVLMAAGVFIYLTVKVALAWGSRKPEPPLPAKQDNITVKLEERLRKVLILLATFAVSITYVSGLNLPGGFWDNTEGGHRLGGAILIDGRHKARLTTFFICNTTTFMVSLLIIMLLLGRKLHERTTIRSREMFGCVVAVLAGLVGAYAAGSCREAGTTVYVVLVVVAGLVCILLRVRSFFQIDEQPSAEIGRVSSAPADICVLSEPNVHIQRSPSSLLLLLATFATAITYPAGLDPPGGVWQDDNGHVAGDPILLATSTIRYRIFFYCNSVAFVASLVTVILFLFRATFRRLLRVVKTVMILELFGLIGAYAAGACREVKTSLYVMALGGAVLLVVVICVTSCFIYHQHELPSYDYSRSRFPKKEKLLHLLATLSTAMSYQAGLNPPAGFWLQDDDEHAAGNPVLLYNHPSRYIVFFYCNSLSFMMSVTTMILLMNRVSDRLDIRRSVLNAATVCTVAGLSCLMGAYAAGSTQHLATSIGIFLLVAVAFLILVVLLLVFLVRDHQPEETEESCIKKPSDEELGIKTQYAKRKHLMLLGILVVGVTYQAGLDPPGGVWQTDSNSHDAGGPAMRDNRKQRYLAFFYSNSTSFAASIIMLLLLLLKQVHFLKKQAHRQLKRLEWPLHIKVMRMVVMFDLLALLVAYAIGSTRDWISSLSVAAPLITVLALILIKVMISALLRRRSRQTLTPME